MRGSGRRYGRPVPWDDLFDDLEVRFAAERDDARRSSEVEAERLRIAALTLRDRLSACRGLAVSVETTGGAVVGTVVTVGADWCLLATSAGDVVIPADAVTAVSMSLDQVPVSVLPLPEINTVTARITVGFVARSLARSRTRVTIVRAGGESLTGTIDRAGVDHLDVAVHDADVPRRPQNVRRVVVLPLGGVAFITPAAGYRTPFR